MMELSLMEYLNFMWTVANLSVCAGFGFTVGAMLARKVMRVVWR